MHSNMENELITHYQSLLDQPHGNKNKAINKITRHIPKLILEEHNQSLLQEITMEEVDQEMDEMSLGKSPRPDRFTMDLFQAYWTNILQGV